MTSSDRAVTNGRYGSPKRTVTSPQRASGPSVSTITRRKRPLLAQITSHLHDQVCISTGGLSRTSSSESGTKNGFGTRSASLALFSFSAARHWNASEYTRAQLVHPVADGSSIKVPRFSEAWLDTTFYAAIKRRRQRKENKRRRLRLRSARIRSIAAFQ